ncbi:MAG: excinuclease ABC subunit UvrC [Candidatus Doudnabacteria bacterium]|nr:excinuclease ABC subunit UvrC [Candidatus Doudnabacteria bacterium]
MQKALADKIKELPSKPGVYTFKDAKGLVLYVGKAINLKNRVRSHFYNSPQPPLKLRETPSLTTRRGLGDKALGKAGELSPRIQLMITQIKDFDYTVTDNELESLLLENNFIKQLKPKYNILLRDDKNYLFVKINLADEIPTISYERKSADKSARYFGPYTSSASIKDTLRLLRKIFPYCGNKKISNHPCFYYHIGKCPGVCIGKISLEEYRKNYINKIMEFLQGRQSEILKHLKLRMQGYARAKLFEKAARVRDQIYALNRVLERQKLVYPKKIDQDVFSVYIEATAAAVNLFVVREGKLIRQENFILENTKGASIAEILSEFLPRYYLEASSWPKEILAPVKQRAPLLSGFSTKKVPFISVPKKGQKLKLIKLGQENAKQYLESQSDKKLLEEARLMSALKELQRVLNLKTLPGRIEAYDISNIQGKNAVGSMIVFDFGRPKKEDYRRFKIKFQDTPDDYAMMREMLTRRFMRSVIASEAKQSQKEIAASPAAPRNDKTWPLPDLILIDGGKGQLSVAKKVIHMYNLNIATIGLAKKLEEIFVPGQPKSLILQPNSIALFLLQRIRDEAHRFAITYHRKLRSKASRLSTLDEIAGIGPAKKKMLLTTFGSVAQIRKATLGELARVVGNSAAEKIKASL